MIHDAIIELGYKHIRTSENITTHMIYKKRNKEITVQQWDDYYNIYLTIQRKSADYSMNIHHIPYGQFINEIKQIKDFEKRMK